MKALYWLLILGASGSVAVAQPAGTTVKLVGIVSVDYSRAILEVVQTNYTRAHNPRAQTRQFQLAVNQTDSGVQVQSIDASKGTATINVAGEVRTLVLDSPNGAEPNKPSTIQLRGVKLQQVIYLYGQMKGRTVLQHPGLKDTGFTLTANPKSKLEAAKALEGLFASHQIAVIPDGEKFVMLIPFALTNKVSPHSNKIADADPTVPPMSVNFNNVPMSKVLGVYGQFLGRPVTNCENAPWAGIDFVQENSLSKGQICYGLETLFAWNGIRVSANNDNTSSWERIPE
jgi:hypothetical protein